MSFEALAELYRDLGRVVVRGGRAYPSVAQAIRHRSVRSVVGAIGGEAALDGPLLQAGTPHVDRVAARSPGLHDGSILVLDEVREDRLHLARSGYLAMLATCDALRAEYLDRAGTEPAALALRARAHVLAGADPLRSGAGRAAAVGVSVATTLRARDGPHRVVLGRRRHDLAADPGVWHVAPSGMLEAGATGDPVLETVQRELEEEIGVVLPDEELTGRLEVLGLGYDLLRLRPELCLWLELPDTPGISPPVPSATEFSDGELLDLSPRGFEALWDERPPGALAPPAAAALALLEDRLGE